MTPDDYIIQPLRDVQDLDAWYGLFVANETADRHQLMQRYLRALYESERDRRQHDKGADHEYPSAGFECWPNDALAGSAFFAVGAIEFTYQINKPTIFKWSIEFAKVMQFLTMARLTGMATKSEPTD